MKNHLGSVPTLHLLGLKKKKKSQKWPQWQIGIAIMNNYDYDSPKEKSTSSAEAFVDYSDVLNY